MLEALWSKHMGDQVASVSRMTSCYLMLQDASRMLKGPTTKANIQKSLDLLDSAFRF